MLDVQRLPIERQRAVGAKLRDLFAVKGRPKYDKSVEELERTLAEKTAALDAGTNGAVKRAVDVSVDSVVAALFKISKLVMSGLPGGFVALDDEQRAMVAAAKLIIDRVFPNGTGFIHDEMSIEYPKLRAMSVGLAEPTVQAAVKSLRLEALVRHFEAHLAPYGRAIRAPDGSDMEVTSDAWHEAFVDFATAAQHFYRKDAAAREALLAPYERELAAHQDELRAARKRAKAKSEAAVAPK